jgi:hypothetical protein
VMSRKDIYVQDVEDARDGYLNTSAAERARERNGYGSGLRDYEIQAVFSDERKAFDYCAEHNSGAPFYHYDDARVEVFPLDQAKVEQHSGTVYEMTAEVRVFVNSAGDKHEVEVWEVDHTARFGVNAPECAVEVEIGTGYWTTNGATNDLKVWGTDYERVRKVYGEKLAELKAEAEGIS